MAIDGALAPSNHRKLSSGTEQFRRMFERNKELRRLCFVPRLMRQACEGQTSRAVFDPTFLSQVPGASLVRSRQPLFPSGQIQALWRFGALDRLSFSPNLVGDARCHPRRKAGTNSRLEIGQGAD